MRWLGRHERGATMMGTPMLRNTQTGIVLWLALFLLSGMAGVMLYIAHGTDPARQRAMQKTVAALAMAKQALLAYAQQPLGLTQCELNCPRPGDLPCPDRNNDGIAETSCSNTARLGRLPWKTLGMGDVRDGSGERLWYAVSERYKNNPRLRPLNLDTAGTWSVASSQGVIWDATQGNGVVAVVIAPMQPLMREDGWVQQRQEATTELAKHYLDLNGVIDHAAPQEAALLGFVMAPNSIHFNDVVLPITASQMHQVMQKQVLAEVKRSLRCVALPCNSYPSPASYEDSSCLGNLPLNAGQCLSVATSIGRLPLDVNAHWSWAVQHLLDGHPQHHWFQQNGWREQVFYVPGQSQTSIIVAGERLSGQVRDATTDKLHLRAYLEASTLLTLHVQEAALNVQSNDMLDRVSRP
ncbi:hypothetical protein [Methylophilus sp. 5]|uniref:hypothetical protein n=1 Tax=Methylophilus sp. 5 TaxID=1112274 RepID=UPI0004BB73EA|nr:hypothetical protein [Methylophilus sp. 5]